MQIFVAGVRRAAPSRAASALIATIAHFELPGRPPSLSLALHALFLGSLVMDRSQYYWVAAEACFATLAEEGLRKDEVAKATASTPFRKGRLTFGSATLEVPGARVPLPAPVKL